VILCPYLDKYGMESGIHAIRLTLWFPLAMHTQLIHVKQSLNYFESISIQRNLPHLWLPVELQASQKVEAIIVRMQERAESTKFFHFLATSVLCIS